LKRFNTSASTLKLETTTMNHEEMGGGVTLIGIGVRIDQA
jgi:hypothetical protein